MFRVGRIESLKLGDEFSCDATVRVRELKNDATE